MVTTPPLGFGAARELRIEGRGWHFIWPEKSALRLPAAKGAMKLAERRALPDKDETMVFAVTCAARIVFRTREMARVGKRARTWVWRAELEAVVAVNLRSTVEGAKAVQLDAVRDAEKLWIVEGRRRILKALGVVS